MQRNNENKIQENENLENSIPENIISANKTEENEIVEETEENEIRNALILKMLTAVALGSSTACLYFLATMEKCSGEDLVKQYKYKVKNCAIPFANKIYDLNINATQNIDDVKTDVTISSVFQTIGLVVPIVTNLTVLSIFAYKKYTGQLKIEDKPLAKKDDIELTEVVSNVKKM